MRVAIVYTEAEPCLMAIMGDCARPKVPIEKSWAEQWWWECQSFGRANGRVLDLLMEQGVELGAVNKQARSTVDLMLAEMERGIYPVSFLLKPASDLDIALVGLIAERMGGAFLDKLYPYPKAQTTLMSRCAAVRRLCLMQATPAKATTVSPVATRRM